MNFTADKVVLGKLIDQQFADENTGYRVYKCAILEKNFMLDTDKITIQGNFPSPLNEKVNYKFTGILIDTKYGVQLKVYRYEQAIEPTVEGMMHYLTNGIVKGIGVATARKIIEKLNGGDLLTIPSNPTILDGIPRLTSSMKTLLVQALKEVTDNEDKLLDLINIGLKESQAKRVLKEYGAEALEKITENPYNLVKDVEGIGFTTADKVAVQYLQIPLDHPDRILAAIEYQLEIVGEREGHVFLPFERLLTDIAPLLSIKEINEDFTKRLREVLHINETHNNSRLFQIKGVIVERIGDDELIYLDKYYRYEIGVAASIKQLTEAEEDEFDEELIDEIIKEFEKHNHIQYAASQRAAILTAINNKAMILTGGPGTGKTTVIKGIIHAFKKLNPWEHNEKDNVVLLAPTGLAAKRLAESTKHEASTIHSYVFSKLAKEDDMSEEERDDNAAWENAYKLLIIDEMSMVNLMIAAILLKTVDENFKVVFVGDQDQLPAIGAGNILSDIIQSDLLPIVELTEVYRQSGESSILDIAHAIKQEAPIPRETLVKTTKDKSFRQVNVYGHQSGSQVIQKVIETMERAIQRQNMSMLDIQVLVPVHKGAVGTIALNRAIQEYFNPNDPARPRKEAVYNENVFRIGDKVMQLDNDKTRNISNGDIGIVISINPIPKGMLTVEAQKMVVLIVDYAGQEVGYTQEQLKQLTLAYACSVHKSQGSEFKLVILPLMPAYIFLNKNMLYTGITRAKQFLVFIGNPDSFYRSLAQPVPARYTQLVSKLKE